MLFPFEVAAQMLHLSPFKSEPDFTRTYSSSTQSCQLGDRCTKCTKITQTGGVTEQRQCFLCPPLIVDIFYSAVLFSSIFLFLTTNLKYCR